MKSQDHPSRTRYRPPAAWYQRLNRLGMLLTSAGLAPLDAVTLRLRGRSSGQTRRIPILRTRYEGSDYLVALAGESQWVRRSERPTDKRSFGAGERRRSVSSNSPRRERPTSSPHTYTPAPPAATQQRTRTRHYYFGLEPVATAADIATTVDYYSVFRIHYANHGRSSRSDA